MFLLTPVGVFVVVVLYALRKLVLLGGHVLLCTRSAACRYPLFTKKKLHNLYGAFGPDESLIGTTSTKMTFDDSDSD